MTVLRAITVSLILVYALVLAGCSSLTKSTDSVPVKTSAGKGVSAPMPEAHRSGSPSASAAWKPLLEKAQYATRRGDYEQALAYLERAQRIDPDSAEVYLGMSQAHRARGDSARASATAERGLLYCTSNRLCDALRAFVQ